jgi:superfamily II DNA helicase RecQ
MLFAKTFKIRISAAYRDADEVLLNDFLESVIPEKLESALIHHPKEPFWSILVIYSPAKEIPLPDGERILFDSYEPLSSFEEILFYKLKSWRDKVAIKEDIPSYLILHDAHLMTLAKLRPTTEDKFHRIKGISPRKVVKYRDEILSFFIRELKKQK